MSEDYETPSRYSWEPGIGSGMTQTIEAADELWEANELFYRQGWTDGLPIIPPTRARVARMVAGCGRAADELVGKIPPKWGEATIEGPGSEATGCTRTWTDGPRSADWVDGDVVDRSPAAGPRASPVDTATLTSDR